MKLREPVLSLQREIAQAEARAAGAVAHLVKARGGNQPNGYSVCQSVVHVRQRAEAMRMSGDHIVEIGLDQEMPAR